jgi:hypothetical protein
MTHNLSAPRSVLAAAVVGLVVSIGCTSPATRGDKKLAHFFETPEWMRKAPWSKSAEEPPEPYPNPVKVAATWTPDVLVQSGRTPTRGFGGRLFFFDEKTQVVPVEGTLTVHGFELDTEGKDSQIRPFKFTPEQFTRHFSQSDFGASYSVWIPWDAVGGEEKRISLVPTFQTTEGKIVQGSAATVILPGRRQDDSTAMPPAQVSQRFESHREAVKAAASRPSGLVTTTIRRYETKLDGTTTLPSASLQQRAQALAAGLPAAAPGRAARYSDVQQAPKPPKVMAASAEMPLPESDHGQTSPTKPVPRRIQIPPSTAN